VEKKSHYNKDDCVRVGGVTDVQGLAKRRHNKSGGVASKKEWTLCTWPHVWAHISRSLVSYWADDTIRARIYITMCTCLCVSW